MSRMRPARAIALILLVLVAALAYGRKVGFETIGIQDPRIGWRGRFDRRDLAGPRAEWPAAGFAVRIRGTGLEVEVDANGGDRLQVIVDGQLDGIVKPARGRTWCTLVAGRAAGEHTIEVLRANEALVGRMQFCGVRVPIGTQLLAAPVGSFKLEVVGDSISCGFGNEAPSEQHHFSPFHENAARAYGALAARELGAEYTCLAWSGRRLYPDTFLPETYHRALPTDPTSTYDLKSWIPEVVVINLCTNDFQIKNPPEEPWVAAYHAFLAVVRERSPKAHVFCAVGPMLTDAWSETGDALREARRYVQRVVREERAAAHPRVAYVEFPVQTPAEGYGADFHPNLKVHARMAQVLVAAIRAARAGESAGTPASPRR